MLLCTYLYCHQSGHVAYVVRFHLLAYPDIFFIFSIVTRDDVKFVNELFGFSRDSGEPFDYDKAPDRGWQEGRKDWSHKVKTKLFSCL